jgi:hypothetical protein
VGRVETVVFNGIKFRRYPDARGASARNYFTPGKRDKQNGVDMLHREIWKFYKGPIPEGHHIHHQDENTSNNTIENFECLPPEEHHERHPHKTWRHKGLLRAHLRNIQGAATDWHKTPDGKRWHSEHRKRLWEERNPHQTITCQQCGEIKTIRGLQPTKYCSGKCSAKARRQSGLDDADFTCECCGITFRRNRFQKPRFCSGKCVKTAYWRQRKGVRPQC